MNTPYHCGFFLKIWDQMFGALYPTQVLIMLQAHIQLCSCIYICTSLTLYPPSDKVVF